MSRELIALAFLVVTSIGIWVSAVIVFILSMKRCKPEPKINQRLRGTKKFEDFNALEAGFAIDKILQNQHVINTVLDYFNARKTFSILVWDSEIVETNLNGRIIYSSKELHPQMTALLQECSLLNINISYVLSTTRCEDFKSYLLNNDLRADEILKDTDNILMRDVANWSKYQLVFLPNAGISSTYEILVGVILKIKSGDTKYDE